MLCQCSHPRSLHSEHYLLLNAADFADGAIRFKTKTYTFPNPSSSFSSSPPNSPPPLSTSTSITSIIIVTHCGFSSLCPYSPCGFPACERLSARWVSLAASVEHSAVDWRGIACSRCEGVLGEALVGSQVLHRSLLLSSCEFLFLSCKSLEKSQEDKKSESLLPTSAKQKGNTKRRPRIHSKRTSSEDVNLLLIFVPRSFPLESSFKPVLIKLQTEWTRRITLGCCVC